MDKVGMFAVLLFAYGIGILAGVLYVRSGRKSWKKTGGPRGSSAR